MESVAEKEHFLTLLRNVYLLKLCLCTCYKPVTLNVHVDILNDLFAEIYQLNYQLKVTVQLGTKTMSS